MEESISFNCINTFGLMEAIRADPEATRQLYTFAAFGVAESLSGLISPFISSYSKLDELMNEHVRSLLITQQQVEAMFNLYRMGKHKKMTDGLKEVMVKWKQNTFKRAKARAELGLEAPKQTRSKSEVLSAFKRYKLDQMEQRAGASTLIARNWPHLLKWSRRRATSKEQSEAKEVKP